MSNKKNSPLILPEQILPTDSAEQFFPLILYGQKFVCPLPHSIFAAAKPTAAQVTKNL